MSHVHKTVSCQAIIAKIAQTFKPPDSSWIKPRIEDIGWAIQAIGYHAGLEERATEYPYITVANNRALVPCDVERIKHIEYMVPSNSNTNILNPDGTTPFPQDETTPLCDFKGIRMRLGSDTSIFAVPRTTQISSRVPYYNLNGDYVYTEFQNGLIRLHYVAFMTDKKGMPKVIDDFDYKSCVEWYLVSQMMLAGYKHSEVTFKEAFAYFEMYRLRAENAVKMLSLDSAERFQSTWSRFVNNIEIGQDFYMSLSSPEFISR